MSKINYGMLARDNARDEIRRRIFKEAIPDYAKLKGLEIGALCSPLLPEDQGKVEYYDILPTETLVEKFADYYPGRDFVHVDHVAENRSIGMTLGGKKFDYFIANHVIEHIPDFIGFFKSVYDSLNDNGKIFLAIPDRRFTFDYDRSDTTAGHLIVDHEDSGTVDAAEHLLDVAIYHKDQPLVYWENVEFQRYNFTDHHHVFCYETCIEKVFKPLIRLRYLNFSVIRYHAEPGLYNEFIVVLRKETNPANLHVLGMKIKLQPPHSTQGRNPYDYRYQLALVAQSGWFDPVWYLETYPSVRNSRLDPLKHYFFWGAYHGFNPSPAFDSSFYLESNSDVKAAGLNPLWHYLHNGIQEGRPPLPSPKGDRQKDKDGGKTAPEK